MILLFKTIFVARLLSKEELFMKKIEAIIRPEKFDIIKDALTEQGYGGMSVSEIKGHGNQKGVSEVWRGKRYRVDLLPKIKVELVVADEAVDKVVQTIISESQTGSIGDGKIFVYEVANAYRVRTGEQGDSAI
jgi:nitrogen regulatory protein P-II 1